MSIVEKIVILSLFACCFYLGYYVSKLISIAYIGG